MEIPETRYAKTVDGVHIAYQTLGEKRPDIVPVGTYFSNLEHDWEAPWMTLELRRFAEMGRVIAFDCRGSGLSDPIGTGHLPSLEERVDDLLAVLDAAGSERSVLIGFADGGPLCCLFAATYPERTEAVVLCNTSPRIAWAPDYPWGMTPEDLDAALHQIESGWGTRDYAAEIVRLGAPSHTGDEEMINWWAKSMRLSASPAAAATLTRMHYAMDVREILPAIHVPTAVLSGDATAQECAAMAARIPGAEFHSVASPDPTVMANPTPYLDEIHRFLDRVRSDEVALDRVLATILFTDIVGSTERQAALGDHVWKDVVQRHHAFVRGVISRWRGHEVDTAGDGFFATFDGPARGIRAARAITEGVRTLGIEVRAGLHTGECEMVDGKAGGLTVVIGARIMALATGSQVLVSQTVKDLVAGSGLTFEDAGEHELKGVPGRWRVYRVLA